MREEEEYKREVIVITIERDNKRLLDIYRRGEEKESLSERAFDNVYDRVEYALSLLRLSWKYWMKYQLLKRGSDSFSMITTSITSQTPLDLISDTI